MDPYLRLLSSDETVPGRLARQLARRFGLPTPVRLRRYSPGEPSVPGSVHCGGTGGRLLEPALATLRTLSADVREQRPDGVGPGDPTGSSPPAAPDEPAPYGVLFDASGITDSTRLTEAYAFLHPLIRRIGHCGRLVVLGSDPDRCDSVPEATAQAALDGLVRSAAKEIPNGGTANLLRVAPDAERSIAGPLGFLLSPRSAYVSGQTVWLRTPTLAAPDDIDPATPLADRTVLVTGAARGIGAEIARTLARDGARVLCLDRPGTGDQLRAVAASIDGAALELDITATATPDTLATRLTGEYDGVHGVVHNAGIVRDRTLGRMTAEEWDTVLAVNLSAQQRIDEALFERGALRPGGRLVSIASLSGIAGNRGQTNYATSKSGVIGRVRALANQRDRAGEYTVNAVAPGFIETDLTRRMPLMPREVGRRLCSLGQGGRPIDVAEAVAFLVSPGAYAVDGNVLRVCGQSMLGA